MVKVLPDLYLDVDTARTSHIGEPRRVIADREALPSRRLVWRLVSGGTLLMRWLTGLLYGVKGDDPASFVALLVRVIGGAAGSLPARRAATVNPADALRAE